jgi:hypothetical protein
VKSIIVPVSKGVRSVFWSNFIDDSPGETLRYGVVDTFYSYSGLLNTDQTNKLSFYTYQLVAGALQGAKFNQVFQGLEKDVYGYAFVKDGIPFYIFWNDSQESKTVRINGEDGKIYEITSLITASEGKLTISSVRAEQGVLSFQLGQEPVIVMQK